MGGNICNASPAGDLLPGLAACDATVVLERVGGRRELPVAGFITGPGTTVLDDGELLTAVRIPQNAGPGGGFWFYRKVAPRRSNALSKLSLYAEAGRSQDGALSGVRIAVGAVAPRVIRLPAAEAILNGCHAAELARVAGDALALYDAEIAPIDDQRSTAVYRRRTALALIRHLLLERIPRYLEHP